MLIPRVDVVYTSKSNLDWSETLRCLGCNTPWHVEVMVTGKGEGRARWGFNEGGAAYGAGIDAFEAAQKRGRKLVRHARCPACGQRLGGTGLVLTQGVGVGLAVAFLGSGLLTAWVSPAIALIVALPAAAAIGWATVVAGLQQADRSVRVTQSIEVPQELVDARRSELALGVMKPNAAVPAPTTEWHVTPVKPGEREVAFSTTDEAPLELDTERSWQKKP